MKTIVDLIEEKVSNQQTCQITGDMKNGFFNGKENVERTSVMRKIKYINKEKNELHLECGRVFIINENLIIE